MKRTICAAAAVAVLAMGFSAHARAQDEGADKGGRHAEFADKMKKRLGLSDEQVGKMEAAWEAQAAALKPLREQREESMRKLEEQVRELASDKDISATLDALDANRKAMMTERQKLESAMAAALKPYQRAKMRLLMGREMKSHRPGERDDWGGRGGPGERRPGRWGGPRGEPRGEDGRGPGDGGGPGGGRDRDDESDDD